MSSTFVGRFPRLRRSALEFLKRDKVDAYPGQVAMRSRAVQGLSNPAVVSFLLPTNGEVIDRRTQAEFEIGKWRLPFDHIALEYEIDPEFYDVATRTVAPRGTPEEQTVVLPSAAVLIVELLANILHCTVITEIVSSGVTMWIPCRGSFALHADNRIAVDKRGLVTGTCHTYGPTSMPDHYLQPADEFGHELQVLTHFAMLCNCENVKPVKAFSPSAAFVRYAKERGKRPPDEYYILDCFLGEQQERKESAGGTHASPRFHVRRGHVRRLPDGRTTWVKQCTVGDASIGKIDKDYRVKPITHGEQHAQA